MERIPMTELDEARAAVLAVHEVARRVLIEIVPQALQIARHNPNTLSEYCDVCKHDLTAGGHFDYCWIPKATAIKDRPELFDAALGVFERAVIKATLAVTIGGGDVMTTDIENRIRAKALEAEA